MFGLSPSVELLPPREVLRIAKETMGAIDIDLAAPGHMGHLVGAAASIKRRQGPWEEDGREFVQGAPKRVLLADPGATLTLTRYRLLCLRQLWAAGQVQQAIVWSRQYELLGAAPWIWDPPLMVCLPWRRLHPQWWDDELERLKAASAATSGFIVFLPPVRPGDPPADIARARAAFHGAAALSGRVLEGSPPLTPWQPCFESTVGRPYSFEPALS
jgi:hypothetical protein